ncbi:hypothetical protein G7Y89_g14826 [Cudoniella acicularis]|uniref:Threonyl/alanyl tRNA synthetase SAD domain-containing protein n=1 Tax=Cudoniella acicularis TaxID=354080 RepID=A0A8H4QYA0_9HELO|nr:hypothetical protein G7Y89_g14826 [Cudoniella acicularis]
MDRYDNLETIGWGMGSENDVNYVDLPRKPSEEEWKSIQDKCNEAIRTNHSITVEAPLDAKSESLPNDYDAEKGVVRVIKIGDIDRNPCCGTHLSQTSHISLLLLHSTQPIRGKHTRMYFTTGDRAISLASTSISSLRSIGKLMSSGPSELIPNIKKMTESASESRSKERKLLLEIAKFEASTIKTKLKEGKNG